MGFLQKLGLVEENPDYSMDITLTANYAEPDVDVNVENVSNDNLVNDIYSANNLGDLSKSIFKVDELINNLPKEMPTETKKATVLGILTSFGLTVEEVVNDGLSRINYLSASMNEIINKNTSEIDSSNSLIEDHKKEIEELSKYIAGLTIANKNCENTIESEVDKISNLIKFVGGEI